MTREKFLHPWIPFYDQPPPRSRILLLAKTFAVRRDGRITSVTPETGEISQEDLQLRLNSGTREKSGAYFSRRARGVYDNRNVATLTRNDRNSGNRFILFHISRILVPL